MSALIARRTILDIAVSAHSDLYPVSDGPQPEFGDLRGLTGVVQLVNDGFTPEQPSMTPCDDAILARRAWRIQVRYEASGGADRAEIEALNDDIMACIAAKLEEGGWHGPVYSLVHNAPQMEEDQTLNADRVALIGYLPIVVEFWVDKS